MSCGVGYDTGNKLTVKSEKQRNTSCGCSKIIQGEEEDVEVALVPKGDGISIP